VPMNIDKMIENLCTLPYCTSNHGCRLGYYLVGQGASPLSPSRLALVDPKREGSDESGYRGKLVSHGQAVAS
jgi:hypothetical protein